MLFTICILALVYILFAQAIFHFFFSAELIEGAYLLYIMTIGLFFLGVYNAYGTNGLIHIGKEKVLMKNSILSSIIGLGLSFILISQFKAYGAAATVTFTRALMAFGVLYLFEKYKAPSEAIDMNKDKTAINLETNLD